MANTPSLKVIPCGKFVRIKISGIECMVTGIQLRFANVIYELTCFEGMEPKIIWMNEGEFDVIGKCNKQNIGFK